MVNLSYRSEEKEIMDDLSDNSASLHRALKELDIINKWLGGNAVTLNAVKKELIKNPTHQFTIADLGCGSGEMLRRIALWCRNNNIKVTLIGFDANPHVVEYAKKHCANFPEISFYAENILEKEFQSRKFDLLLCTLFLHHFKENQLINLLAQFKEQAKVTIINDLHRHWLAYYSILWITKAFSKSPMVQNDACLSVWRAFKKKDWKNILKEANIKDYTLNWRWAFRWKLVY
ncbi:methyltransferase domain-containing protein [Marivirga sp. S37H4]|uniref:Methyltransferase domain-containing protein n=1 Tax=Marivirga aurantiaca TaxID=2802615 RepID=A0A934X285_9BACT|nr:methyltransferase domain-containing protein [Marivirga aurantiaca]MBK6267137.1 methyltransferase domain-containing protein [Marivirga aurantiaca]